MTPIKVAIALLALQVLLLTAYWHHLPVERDTAIYSVLARELLNGSILYRDIWDHKPPGIFIFYSIAQVFFGPSPLSITVLNLLCRVLFVYSFLFATSKIELTSNRTAKTIYRWILALIGALLLCDPFLEANQSNTENFIASLLLLAITPVITPKSSLRIPCLAFLMIVLLKPQAALPILLPLIYQALISPDTRRQSLRLLCLFSILAILSYSTLFIYYSSIGAFPSLWEALVLFNSNYSGSISLNLLNSVSGEIRPSIATYIIGGFLIIAIVLGFKIPSYSRNLLLLSLIGALGSIFFTGRNYNHYFLILPPIILFSIYISLTYFTASFDKILTKLLLALAILTSYYETALTVFTPNNWSLKRHGSIYLDSRELGDGMKGRTFFNLGSEAGLYFYSMQRPVSRLFYLSPIPYLPRTDSYLSEITSQLYGAKPEFLVISQEYLSWVEREDRLSNIIGEIYDLSTTQRFGNFTIARRK